MSLLEEIKRFDAGAAKVLERADCRSNSDIQSLTREDLNELFPGVTKIKFRKTIRHIIHKQKPIHLVLNELKGFLPSEYLKAALTGNGALSEYLLILRDLKTQIEKVSQFIEAHITLLEEITMNQNEKGLARGTTSSPTVPADLRDGSVDMFGGESFVHLADTGISTEMQGSHGRGITTGSDHTTTSLSPSRPSLSVGATGTSEKVWKACAPTVLARATVKVLSVISGETHGSHQTLWGRVNSRGGLQLVHTDISQECEAVVVFCPICSRPESDIEAALNMIPVSLVNKPVILVLLHHKRDANFTAPRIQLPPTRHKTVTMVNALYHDSLGGLFSCSANEQAVSEMHAALLEHSSCSGAASRHDASGEAAGKGCVGLGRSASDCEKLVDAGRDVSRHTDDMYESQDMAADAGRDVGRHTDGMYESQDKNAGGYYGTIAGIVGSVVRLGSNTSGGNAGSNADSGFSTRGGSMRGSSEDYSSRSYDDNMSGSSHISRNNHSAKSNSIFSRFKYRQ